MRVLLCIAALVLLCLPAHAAVKLAVSQKSGAAVIERAGQLARQISAEAGAPVEVVELPDHIQLEAWLNRYATAELALVEATYVADKPGRFVMVGSVGRELVLIGRQGIAGDLPQRAGRAIGRDGERPLVAVAKTSGSGEQSPAPMRPSTSVETRPAEMRLSPSKSINEDRYFVSYVYRERLNRTPDTEHLEYWTRQLQSGAVTKQQLFALDCDLEKKACGNR